MSSVVRANKYVGYGTPPGPPSLPGCYVDESSVSNSGGHKIELLKPAGNPTQRTTYPMVTGSSILGIKYKDGVLMAADTMAAYGTTLRYKSVERLFPVGDCACMGASGEHSDVQYINTLLEEVTTQDFAYDDGETLTPAELHNYLTRVMYNRRNKFDPLWNSLIIGGVRDGVPYLGSVNMLGISYTDAHLATGFGTHMARPIFRNEHREDMSEEEGVRLLEKCMRVLYYRDRGQLNKIQIAKITSAGVEISKPYKLTTEWGYDFFVNPTKGVEGSW